MTSRKKKLDFYKIHRLVAEYRLVFFVQHHNISVEHWSHLRTQVARAGETRVLAVKNTLVEKFFETYQQEDGTESPDLKTLVPLLQGPCFLVGCRHVSEFPMVWKIVNSNPNVLCVGGLYDQRALHHKDLARLASLDDTLYHTLLQLLTPGAALTGVLDHAMDFSFLNSIPTELVEVLQIHGDGQNTPA